MDLAPAILALIMLVWTGIAVALAIIVRAYRAGTIHGPQRWPVREPIWRLWVTILVVLFVWISVPIAWGVFHGIRHATTQPLTPPVMQPVIQPSTQTTVQAVPWTAAPVPPVPTPSAPSTQAGAADLSVAEMMVMTLAAYGVAYLVLVVVVAISGKPVFQWLGIDRRVLDGIRQGIVGTIITIPVVYWAGVLTMLFWDYIGYQHPNEHELLKALGQAHSPALQWVIVFVAVVAAPVFEETFFRGLLQTAVARLFARRRVGADPSSPQADAANGPLPVLPLEASGAVLAEPVAGGMPPPPAPPPATPTEMSSSSESQPVPLVYWRAQRRIGTLGLWLAVLIVSVVFGSFHEPWSAPPIIVLAICLGYAYERTGNLWTNITMHALFNAFNVAQVMMLAR